MQIIKSGLMIVMLLLLIACSKSPMQWLQSDAHAEHLTDAFWTKEYEARSPLWQEATNYCKGHPEKINCSAVNEVMLLQSNNTELAPDGSGHEIWTPQ